MALDAQLVAFLRQEAQRAWEWGEHDCGLWLADWIILKTGRPDPAAHLRGTYTSAAECYERHGAAAPLPQIRALARAGQLRRTREPEQGDIAALDVLAPDRRLIVGAIRTERGFVFPACGMGKSGLTKILDGQARMIAAWGMI